MVQAGIASIRDDVLHVQQVNKAHLQSLEAVGIEVRCLRGVEERLAWRQGRDLEGGEGLYEEGCCWCNEEGSCW